MRRPAVLLVDDVAENLVALEALLCDQDVDLLKARSGSEALELLLVNEVAVALVDVQMPGMDGFELAELMRGSARTRHVPILFVTAGARDESRIFRGYEAGGVDYLLKPIEPLVLRNKVGTFLRLYLQQRQLGDQLQELERISEEREKVVAELRETLRLNELFLAALGHDLRSPLGAILASAQLLERASSDQRVQRAAGRITSSSEVMSEMIESLLDLAQARQGGGIRLRLQSADLADVVERVVGEHRAVAPERTIDVVHTGDLQGTWDPPRLHRLLSNLVGNAVRHGSPDVPIEVVLDGTAADRAEIRVANGGAIPPHVLPDIFNPFRGTTAARRNGLGLGLFIVRQIANAHGGDVEVRSSDADGTCVTVSIRRHVQMEG